VAVTWTLVEPCCGTAALTMHLLGARKQLVPRQGSKWFLRRELASLVQRLGFMGAPSRVILSDASPWARVVQQVLRLDRSHLLAELGRLVAAGERDPRMLHDLLHGARVPSNPTCMAARLLWLQRMAYAGKAVGVVEGRWSSPGLNPTSAYGVAATERFGEVRPLGAALLKVVNAAPTFLGIEAEVGLARPHQGTAPTLVYLDPPYLGVTGYTGAELGRDQVVELAQAWARAGAVVVVSEATAVQQAGWHAAPIGSVTQADLLFRARHRTEWVTWRGGLQLELFGRAA